MTEPLRSPDSPHRPGAEGYYELGLYDDALRRAEELIERGSSPTSAWTLEGRMPPAPRALDRRVPPLRGVLRRDPSKVGGHVGLRAGAASVRGVSTSRSRRWSSPPGAPRRAHRPLQSGLLPLPGRETETVAGPPTMWSSGRTRATGELAVREEDLAGVRDDPRFGEIVGGARPLSETATPCRPPVKPIDGASCGGRPPCRRCSSRFAIRRDDARPPQHGRIANPVAIRPDPVPRPVFAHTIAAPFPARLDQPPRGPRTWRFPPPVSRAEHPMSSKAPWITYRPELEGPRLHHPRRRAHQRSPVRGRARRGRLPDVRRCRHPTTWRSAYKASKRIFGRDKCGDWKFCQEEDIRRIVGDNNTGLKLTAMADAGESATTGPDILPKEKSVLDVIRVACYVDADPRGRRHDPGRPPEGLRR